MFVNEYYNDYKYVVGLSDNYIILTNVSSVNASYISQKTIPIIYQYLNPSFLTYETTRTYSADATFNEIDISNSFFARSDCLGIILIQFLIIFFVSFIFNALTRFVRKGGVLFGN